MSNYLDKANDQPFFGINLQTRYRWAICSLTGAIGLVWLVIWLRVFRQPEQHLRLSPDGLAYIRSDPPESIEKISYLRLLPHRQTLACVVAKFLTDSIWRWYLYPLPLFFNMNFTLYIKSLGPLFLLIYCLAYSAALLAAGSHRISLNGVGQ